MYKYTLYNLILHLVYSLDRIYVHMENEHFLSCKHFYIYKKMQI